MKVPTPQYRCPLGRLQPRPPTGRHQERGWRDQHILVVNESDERLDFIEREFVRRRIGERLYGLGGRRDMTEWTIEDVAARFEEAEPLDDACPCACAGLLQPWPAISRGEWEAFAADEPVSTFPQAQRPSTGCWRRCVGCSGWRSSNAISSGCGPSATAGGTSRSALPTDRTTAWRRWQRAMEDRGRRTSTGRDAFAFKIRPILGDRTAFVPALPCLSVSRPPADATKQPGRGSISGYLLDSGDGSGRWPRQKGSFLAKTNAGRERGIRLASDCK